MMDFRQLSIQDLKTNYIDRWGFVFVSQPFDRSKCQLIADTLVQHDITKDQPEFVVDLAPNVVAFIYPVDCDFDGPTLFQKSLKLRMMGIQVDILKAFLNEH